MEKLINSIPKEFIWGTEKGEELHHGFCLRYSPVRKTWVCGYGKNLPKKHIGKYIVEANDPVEALADFVDLLKNKS